MSPEYVKILEYAAWGGVGGIAGAMTKGQRIELPRIVLERESDGHVRKFIDPGFLGSIVLGAVLAIYFDTSPQNALAWGVASGYVGPAILGVFTDAFMKFQGYSRQQIPTRRRGDHKSKPKEQTQP